MSRSGNSGQVLTCNVQGCDTVGATSLKRAAEEGLPRIYRGMCQPHWHAWRKWGDPTLRKPRGWATRNTGVDHPNWKGDGISYSGAHHRVLAQRGRATQYVCADCGEPARDWGYNGQDPNQLFGCSHNGKDSWSFYSSDPRFYEPLCRRCHSVRDATEAANELREYREWKHRTGLTLADLNNENRSMNLVG